MPLDWLNTPLDADIGDLIARKKRAKTIELLRSQLQGRMVPPVQMRLQLADLLVQAGREAEALPVLIGLADEFAGDGFVAKAVAILKRVDRIQPGREDVESRLARLVTQQQRSVLAAAPGRRQAPEFGIEEIPEDGAEPAAESQPADSAVAATPAAAEVVDAAVAIPAAAAATVAPTETETSRRVRGVFRRFLASLPGGGSSAEVSPSIAPPAAPPPQVPPSVVPPAETAVAPTESTDEADEAVRDDSAEPIVSVADADAAAVAIPDTVPDAAPEKAADTAADTAPDSETVDASDAIVPEPEVAEPLATAAAERPPAAEADDEPITARYRAIPPEAWAAGPPEGERPSAPPATVPPAATGGSPQGHGVTQKIKGAFRWLVASLASPAETTAAPAGSEPPADASAVSNVARAVAGEPPASPPEAPATEEAATGDDEPISDEVFEERLLDLVQDILHQPGSRPAADAAPLDRRLVLRYAQRLLATPLFGALTEEELLAVVRGLRLQLHGPGDILVTEGERGQSVFILAAGSAKVFVRSPSGRNFPVAALREGEFFGEISTLSGRPRSATVTASSPCELLELDRPTLDQIARTHPHVADVLEEFYIRRASSPEAAAVRAVPLDDAGTERKAIEVLEAHFGQSRWDPRMRLRLADVLLKAGKYEDAVPVLIGLADELAKAGFPDKAIAVLKKIEKIQRRDIEVVNLAPLARGVQPAAPATAAPPFPPPADTEGTAARPHPRIHATAEFFEGWLVDVLRDRVASHRTDDGREEAERAALASIRGYGPGLLASPLFEDFTDEELLAVIRGLRLLTFEAGDIIITEGEPGQSLFVLTTGTVKVFVRDPGGRNVALCPLGEGAFFGEIATLSGRPRSATVTAASRCELLELDKPALETVLKVHPRVRAVLEEHYIARANDPEAAAIRDTRRAGPPPDGAG